MSAVYFLSPLQALLAARLSAPPSAGGSVDRRRTEDTDTPPNAVAGLLISLLT